MKEPWSLKPWLAHCTNSAVTFFLAILLWEIILLEPLLTSILFLAVQNILMDTIPCLLFILLPKHYTLFVELDIIGATLKHFYHISL